MYYIKDWFVVFIYFCFLGDAVNTKSKRHSEKLLPNTPAVEAAISPLDPMKEAKSMEEKSALTPKAEPAKDHRNRSKGKNTMDRQSTKSGASSPAPRITIKLVAKKKMKTVKELHKKSVKKLKIEGIQDQPKAKDIQDDQISSAHVKLKTEPHDDKHGTQDKGGGILPARRRGRSASKTTESVCQSSAKNVADDQNSERKSADQLDAVEESGAVESKANTKQLKHKDIVTEQGSNFNQQVTRRSHRVTNPLSKRLSDSAAEPESPIKSDAGLPDSKSKVSQKGEAKPSMRGNRRRQSKRLNKDVALPENHGPSSTETLQPTGSLPSMNEGIRVPSLKLMKVKNPKYGPQPSGKNSTRKKKRKKFIWTLTLVKRGSPKKDPDNTVKLTEETGNEVDQSNLCDNISMSLTGMDQISKEDGSTPQQSNKTDSKDEEGQNYADMLLEEKSTSLVEVDLENANETHPQEITKLDSGKVVPPLQIKKVSSPGKHKSSKPSFLIQQVSPLPEKVEAVLKDGGEVKEDKTSGLEAEVLPTRRLRRRTSSVDSLKKKSDRRKPVTTKKRRSRTSPQHEATLKMPVEDSSQVLTEECSSHVLTENSSQVTDVNPPEVPDKDSPKIADDPSEVPGEVPPQMVENEVEPQIEEAKPLPVPFKPRKCRNNKLGKKKSIQRKKSVVSLEAAADVELSTVEALNTESVLKEDSQALVTSANQSEPTDCIQPEAEQDTVSVEEELIQPPVKEETDIQLIDSQQPLTLESQESYPKTCLQRKSLKKVKKKRKGLIGQHPKHRLRGRDGKFAPLTLSGSQGIFEEDDNISTPAAATALAPTSKLIGVNKKYKKRQPGLQLFGCRRPKPESKIVSKLLEIGLDNDGLKQEETDTLVDGTQADVVDPMPGKTKFVKNIKHFIMPVVSARSSRVIKTPQRFMDDAGMSVLPRRNSPKKGLQLGLQIRPGKRREEGTGRAMSPILPVDEEDILSEAQLDVDLFSTQDLDDSSDLAHSLFSETRSEKMEKKRSLLKNSSFKWHVPEESSEEMFTLDKELENEYDDLFLSSPVDKPRELLSTDLRDAQKKKTSTKFNKQTAHLKIYQRLKKLHKGLPKSKSATEMESLSKPLQSPVDLAEGLDDEAMSISLRQRNTNAVKDKSKLKIEDLDAPGVVRKVSVCVRTMKSKSLAFPHDKEEDLAGKDIVQLHSGKCTVDAKCYFLFSKEDL